jgi:hypothetical protein
VTKLKKRVARQVECGVVPHGVATIIAVALYPGGVIGLREHRRRREYMVEVGPLYARLVAAAARKRRL